MRRFAARRLVKRVNNSEREKQPNNADDQGEDSQSGTKGIHCSLGMYLSWIFLRVKTFTAAGNHVASALFPSQPRQRTAKSDGEPDLKRF